MFRDRIVDFANNQEETSSVEEGESLAFPLAQTFQKPLPLADADPDHMVLMESWHQLPHAVRAGIVATVRASNLEKYPNEQ